MTCDVFQTELLNSADPRQLSASLLQHAKGCVGCQLLAARAAQVEGAVSMLPVPTPSANALQTFLHQLATQPVTPRQPLTTGDRWKLPRLIASLAASVLVLAGTYWVLRTPGTAQPVATLPKHDLLAKQVQHTVALAQARTAPNRLALWSNLANELSQEAQSIHRVASSDDLASLAGLYETAVQNGVLKQAEAIPETVSAVERVQVLREATARLERAEADAEQLSQQAPPQALAGLKRLAGTAKKGRERLQTLLKQGGA